jgi:drug/metabolite transporter (DMT)-like permease
MRLIGASGNPEAARPPNDEATMEIAVRNVRLTIEPIYAALALTALLWASNFVIGRAVRGDVAPATLNFLRWAIALAVLLPFTLHDIRAHRVTLVRHWKLVAMLGLTGIAAFQTLCYVVLTMTTALNAILLQSLAPLAIVLVSRVALRERVTRHQGLGLATSLAGAAVLILHGDVATLVGLRFNAGDLLGLLAVGLWAVYSVLLRRRPVEVPPLVLHTSSVAAGTLWMLPAFAWQIGAGGALPTGLGTWAAVGFIAVFSSAIAHALWVRGVAAIGPNRAGVFIHLMPLFGAVLAITFLGEALGAFHVIGSALVLCGVALATRKPATRTLV